MKNDKQGARPAAPRQASMARLHLFLTMALTASIAIAATAVSIGVARAQGMHAMAQPDTSLVVALMVAAIGVMGGLSAIAMRLAGRSRHR
jgi:FtsH-binding integral membrane protein